ERLYQLQEELNRYPSVWEDIKNRLKKKQDAWQKAVTTFEDRSAERRRIEQDLRISSEKLKQYQAQQMMVKTARELTALNNQMEGLKKSIARMEERAHELLNSDESLGEQLRTSEAEVRDYKEKAKSERERIRDQVNKKK